MRKIRDWILPLWAKQEIRRLEAENAELERRLERMRAYAKGLERGGRKVTVTVGEKRV